MRSIACAAIAAACLTWLGCSARPTAPAVPRVIDLGHALDEGDPSWEGKAVYSRGPVATMEKDGYFADRFVTDSHFGTHVDAPAHFGPGGQTVELIAANRLVRPGVCIDITGLATGNEDYQLTPADIESFERANGAIAEGTIVLIATGWDRRWREAGRYMNERDGVKHFPGVSAEAAALLARDRKVAAIGIDTPSVDYGPSTDFAAHHVTAPLGVYQIENAARLTELPRKGFLVVVAPVKLTGGSGAPARVFALLPQ
jgi:kynurenine formamidase